METTTDLFLGNRLAVRQPRTGFRAGLDAVMLAAAVPAATGDTVMELGSGSGVAGLCIAARVSGASVAGVEIDSALVVLAQENARANGLEDRARFITADAFNLPTAEKREYAHVCANPPFHIEKEQASPDRARARARHAVAPLADWLALGLRRTVSGGTFTVILRADLIGEALSVTSSGGVSIFPLWPKRGEHARRIIVQHRKNARSPTVLLPGLVLHEDDGSYTEEANAVLRGRAPLRMRAD